VLKDFKDVLCTFNDHHVEYLVVGGFAVSYHAQPRATKDLDVFVNADASNAKKVFAALAAFGAPVAGYNSRDFEDPNKFFRFGREPVAIDILPSISGVVFREAWARRLEVVIDEESGLRAFFISKTDLIASKLAAGRTRDLADVEEINKADDRGE